MSERYSEIVKVYFTPEQLGTIKKYAKKEGLKLSPYLRVRGLLKVPFSVSDTMKLSLKRIQEEWTWTKVKKTDYHGGPEDKEKVNQHVIYMDNCINDPEFQKMLETRRRIVNRAILLENRKIPKGSD